MLTIRKEKPQDLESVRTVNDRAFGQPAETNIVDQLRQNCPEFVSLVAVDTEGIIGHIVFSPAVIETGDRIIHGMGLAPMAVLPEHQRRDIGSQLVKAGLAAMQQSRQPFVIVLGHPEYYPRFGFEPASRRGIVCEYDGVPDAAFMIRVLKEEVLQGVSGVAKYRPEFAAAM
jgi:putative acetyltransferase